MLLGLKLVLFMFIHYEDIALSCIWFNIICTKHLRLILLELTMRTCTSFFELT
jgi:hypothetical protein